MYRASLIVAILLLPSVSVAAGGAFEINQACVAEGCFPGDAPGFPVTLSQRGSYVLTSDLEVPDRETSGIVFTASDIALDLNRFTVRGPVVCTDSPAQCGDTGTATGIDGYWYSNLRISNGSVIGFSHRGVLVGPNSTIDNLLVGGNAWRGIVARAGSFVIDCKTIGNQDVGLETRDAVTVRGLVTTDNGTGLATGGSIENGCARIEDAIISRNGLGVYDWGCAHITNSTIASNYSRGIANINGASTYEGNHVIFNTTDGIILGGGTALGNPAAAVVLRNNRVSANGSNLVVPPESVFVDAGGNVCGTGTCP